MLAMKPLILKVGGHGPFETPALFRRSRSIVDSLEPENMLRLIRTGFGREPRSFIFPAPIGANIVAS
nr:hypothetical protein K4M20_00168 [Agrobacterium fabrum]